MIFFFIFLFFFATKIVFEDPTTKNVLNFDDLEFNSHEIDNSQFNNIFFIIRKNIVKHIKINKVRYQYLPNLKTKNRIC